MVLVSANNDSIEVADTSYCFYMKSPLVTMCGTKGLLIRESARISFPSILWSVDTFITSGSADRNSVHSYTLPKDPLSMQ